MLRARCSPAACLSSPLLLAPPLPRSLTHAMHSFIQGGIAPLTNTLVSQSHPLMVCSVTVSTKPWFALSQSHPLMVCSVTVSTKPWFALSQSHPLMVCSVTVSGGPWPLLLILWYHSLTHLWYALSQSKPNHGLLCHSLTYLWYALSQSQAHGPSY